VGAALFKEILSFSSIRGGGGKRKTRRDQEAAKSNMRFWGSILKKEIGFCVEKGGKKRTPALRQKREACSTSGTRAAGMEVRIEKTWTNPLRNQIPVNEGKGKGVA